MEAWIETKSCAGRTTKNVTWHGNTNLTLGNGGSSIASRHLLAPISVSSNLLVLQFLKQENHNAQFSVVILIPQEQSKSRLMYLPLYQAAHHDNTLSVFDEIIIWSKTHQTSRLHQNETPCPWTMYLLAVYWKAAHLYPETTMNSVSNTRRPSSTHFYIERMQVDCQVILCHFYLLMVGIVNTSASISTWPGPRAVCPSTVFSWCFFGLFKLFIISSSG